VLRYQHCIQVTIINVNVKIVPTPANAQSRTAMFLNEQKKRNYEISKKNKKTNLQIHYA